ncbi:MAG: serine kinase [Bauldia sp.]
MAGHSATYDLDGHHFEVSATNERMLEGLDWAVGALRTEPVTRPFWRLDIVEGPQAPTPPGAKLLASGPVDDLGDCKLYETDDGYHFRYPENVVLSLRPAARAATVVAPPGATSRTIGTAAMSAMEAALDAAGSVMVHAAGLTRPGGGPLILLHAPSGSGKTTAALALAAAGFGFCSDDAMIFRDQGDGFAAWGLPRDVKVHKKTVAMLPWLRAYVGDNWDEGGEQAVGRHVLQQLAPVVAARAVPVAALFRLARVGRPETEIAPLSRTDMLLSLAADNVRASLAGLLPLQQRRFGMLARLVARVPVFEIRFGTDPAGLAPAIAETLGWSEPRQRTEL